MDNIAKCYKCKNAPKIHKNIKEFSFVKCECGNKTHLKNNIQDAIADWNNQKIVKRINLSPMEQELIFAIRNASTAADSMEIRHAGGTLRHFEYRLNDTITESEVEELPGVTVKETATFNGKKEQTKFKKTVFPAVITQTTKGV